jgi:hypothetical protein
MTAEEPSDEMLMRLADGELAPEEAAALQRRLAAEPSLAGRYAVFARSRRAVADAFAPVAAQPVPDALLAAVLAADRASRPPPAPAAAPAQVIAFPPPRRAPARWIPLALAASVAALLAAPAGYLLGRGAQRESALLDPLAGARDLVATTLESTPSGTRRADGALAVQPFATHAVRGGVCRDFLLESASGASLGVACRDDGTWRLRAVVRLEGGDALRAASADHPAIAATLEGLGSEPPMDAAREAALIARGWR